MKNIYKTITKTILGSLLLGFMAVAPANAQFGDIGAFLKAGAADAEILTREYIRPLPTGFGTGLNAGFTEGAGAKKTLGFSLQVRSSVAFAPTSAQRFDVAELNLSNIVPADPSNTVTPTLVGKNSSGPLMEIQDDDGNRLSTFNMPRGFSPLGFNIVPAPTIQANVGLIKSTDITLRFMPEVKLGDFGRMNILGGAIKHGINQYIPGGKLLPVDLSIMVGFNKISLDADLDVQPATGAVPNDPTNPGDFSNQGVTTETNTFVLNAYVGKSLPFISVYGGLGYQKASLDINVEGDYPVELPFNRYDVISDPFSFSLDSESAFICWAVLDLDLGF